MEGGSEKLGTTQEGNNFRIKTETREHKLGL